MTITSSRAAGPAIALLCAALLAACGDPRCPRGYLQKGDTCYRIKDAGALDASEDPVEPGGDDAGDDPEGDGASELPNGDAGAPGGASQDAAQSAFDADGSSPSRDADTSEAATGPGDADTTAPDAGGANDASAPDAASPATCASQPCQNGGTCMDGASGFTCRCSEPYTGDRCELEICGSTTIQGRADLEAARVCKEIRGNLQLFGGVVEITTNDLPHLTVVTGDLLITNRYPPGAERVTLGSLAEVHGKVDVSLAALISTVSFPALTTIGTPSAPSVLWIAQAPALGRLEMPKLAVVHGDVAVQHVTNLCSMNASKAATVSGSVRLTGLPNVPYSDFARLIGAASSGATAHQVGCCVLNDSFGCAEYSAGCPAVTCP